MDNLNDNDTMPDIQPPQEINTVSNRGDFLFERREERTSFQPVDYEALAEVPQAFAAFYNYQQNLWCL